MLRAVLAVALAASMLPCAGSAQDRPGPASPGSAGPTWNRAIRLSDGRTFVTDGAMLIDAAVAKPAALPDAVLPPETARTVEAWLSAPSSNEFALAQFSPRDGGQAYAAPSGLGLSATYLDFLRRTLPPAQVRLRTRGEHEPMIVLLNGVPIGVVMPVRR